ncbi:hypothetical protein BC628DRAFT_1421415 [Trametes gibbosa]|nr:hypothetical protein BC628DRAFT_1421415 [Trametes gibbosa]
MENLHCVCYNDVSSVLEVLQPYDDGFMNMAIGALSDYSRDATPEEASKPIQFIALYRGHTLIDWQLMSPQSTEHLLSPALLDIAAQKLATTLLEGATCDAVMNVSGHAAAVEAFLKAWAARAQAKGTHLRIGDPVLVTRSSYATRESLPPLLDASANFFITPATTDDLSAILPLHMDFLKTGPGPRAVDVEAVALQRILALGLIWVCRVDGYIAGYIILGRISPRTIAIRNVYVSANHRRNGIAGAMVRAMSRHYLGIQPVGYKGVPDETPTTGVKDIVCINVAEPEVERIYRRAGFLFPDNAGDGSLQEGHDPISGQKAWFSSARRGFKP